MRSHTGVNILSNLSLNDGLKKRNFAGGRNFRKLKFYKEIIHTFVSRFEDSGVIPTLNSWAVHDNGNQTTIDEREKVCSHAGLKRSLKYYLQNTTLHGLKYLAEDELTISERVFFGLAFIMVILLSSFFISNIYVKWSVSPIIVSASAKQKLTTDIPFPAITICNLNQALRSKVETITRPSFNYSLLMSLCDQNDPTVKYVGTWSSFKRILINVAQPCSEMLLYCSFGGRAENCSDIFSSVLTDDGLCCAFNALDSSFLLRNYRPDNYYVPIDWTPEKGYAKDLPMHFFPRTSGGTGSLMGLTVVLNASSAEYYCSKSNTIGFKILAHNPAEFPKISNYGFLVTAGREARIPIEPIYQDAAPTIRSIKRQIRRCLFSDEGELLYYRIYSRKNCELECEAKILLTKCKCVLYYLPRIDPNARICGPDDSLCTDQIQKEIESSDLNISCTACWPGCFELSYKTAVTSSNLIRGDFFTTADFPPYLFDSNVGDMKDLSILHFFYLSNIFRSNRKSERFGLTEFLSNTGGLLGLFMGFSIFSLIEIIYYITVRPYCANRKASKSYKRNIKTKFKIPPNPRTRSDKCNIILPIPMRSNRRKKIFVSKLYRNSQPKVLKQSNIIDYKGMQVFPYID